MDKSECTTTEREALHSWRFHHPHPRVQRKMEAIYLQSQGLASEAIWRLCAMSTTTFYRSLHAYRVGGIEALQEVPVQQQQSPLAAYRTRIEADVRQRAPSQCGRGRREDCRPDGSPAWAAAGASVLKVLGDETT